MPTYDFKCKKCNLVKEKTMSFEASERGIVCECGGTMERQFIPNGSIICKWDTPYKPGMNAKEDRKRAFISQEEKGLLPKGINEHNANFADLM